MALQGLTTNEKRNAIEKITAGRTVAEIIQLLSDPNLHQFIEDRRGRVAGWFSNLQGYDFTSRIDKQYNCIAWANEDTKNFWWPSTRSYWPPGVPREVTLVAFEQMLALSGYARCGDGSPEYGFQKVALYAKNGTPTHAARQLDNGKWTSKLGVWEDIEHDLPEGVGGSSEYGDVVAFFQRPKANIANAGKV